MLYIYNSPLIYLRCFQLLFVCKKKVDKGTVVVYHSSVLRRELVAKRFLLCRPENSLLAEDLEYDSAVRQAPVFTEEVARKLEDIIR
jgi:hypothetical protein